MVSPLLGRFFVSFNLQSAICGLKSAVCSLQMSYTVFLPLSGNHLVELMFVDFYFYIHLSLG